MLELYGYVWKTTNLAQGMAIDTACDNRQQ